MDKVKKIERKIELKKTNGLDTSQDEVEMLTEIINTMMADKDLFKKYEEVKKAYKEQEDAFNRIKLPKHPLAQIETLLNVISNELESIKQNDNAIWHMKYIGYIVENLFYISEEHFLEGKIAQLEDEPKDSSFEEWIYNMTTTILSAKETIKQLRQEEIHFWITILYCIESHGYNYIAE